MKRRRHTAKARPIRRSPWLRRLESLEDRNMLAGVAAGTEFLVNGGVLGSQQASEESTAVSAAASGAFVVAYNGQGAGDNDGVFARQFTAGGVAGNAFLVNATISGSQHEATVSVADDGRFVVAWSGEGNGDLSGVFARLYSASGVAQGSEFLVNGTIVGNQHAPSVAMGDDGAFVVTWQGNGSGDVDGIFARRYNAAGVAQGNEFRINNATSLDQCDPAVAIADDGSFVVSWTSSDQDGAGVYARRFSAAGAAIGNEFLVNSTTASDQINSSVGVAADGRFVVAWNSYGQDGSGYGVFAQRYTAAGVKAGGEFQVNTTTGGHQLLGNVSMISSGRFAVTWSSEGQDGSGYGVFVQQYDAEGVKDGIESRVNATRSGDQWRSSVAFADNAVMILAWNGAGIGDNDGVIARRYSAGTTPGGDTQGPTVTARLANDTAPGNTTNGDGNTSDPAIAGTIADASIVAILQISLDGSDFATVPNLAADVRGNFNLSRTQLQQALGSAINDGNHTLLVRAIDANKNESNAATVAFTLDTVAPTGATTNLDLVAASDTGLSNTDNITNDSTPTVTVSAAAGTIVTLLANGIAVGSATSVAGTATITASAVPEGVVNFSAIVEDQAGNNSAGGQGTLQITIDVTPPAVPSFDMDPATESDPDGNQFTSTAPVTLLGTTSANTTVQVVGGNINATSGANGAFTLSTVPLNVGVNQVTVQASDVAGNVSQFTRALTFSNQPVLLAPIPDMQVNQNSADRSVSLENFFVGDGLSFTVNGNTGPNFVTATVVGSSLKLSFAPGAGGTANITVRAVDGALKFVEDTFQVKINSTPALVTPLADITTTSNAANAVLNLGGVFADKDNVGTIVRFNTSLGAIDMELFDGATPITVANFLKYVNDLATNGGDYPGTVVHRSANLAGSGPIDILQGGGYDFPGFAHIATDPAIVNEFLTGAISNTIGTIAMAKTSDPNSATSEWFINVRDTSSALDNTLNSGGFTVFGRIIGNGMTAVNDIAALPTFNKNGFATLPLRNYTQTDFNNGVAVTANNVVQVITTEVNPAGVTGALGQANLLNITIANSNPNLVNATLSGKRLTLDYNNSLSGTATITIRATDASGAFVEDSFTVTVNAPSALQLAEAPGVTPPLEELLDFANYDARPAGAEVQTLLQAAIARWAAAGLDASSLDRLANVSVQTANLPGSYLGMAAGDRVWLDVDAAGAGWFVDATPDDDSEFGTGGSAGDRVDMLSVLAHELGHVLGLDDGDFGADLMSEAIVPGLRSLPTSASVDAVFSGR